MELLGYAACAWVGLQVLKELPIVLRKTLNVLNKFITAIKRFWN